MKKVIVIGGGAAGMMAAIFSARNDNQVILIEQNEKLGKKLFITGKGRCNVTNDSDSETLLSNVVSNYKFLYSGFYEFDSAACKRFFEDLGVELKTERGDRVFPKSDHSSDIIRALENELGRLKVEIRKNTKVTDLVVEEIEPAEDDKHAPTKRVKGVVVQNKQKLLADSVILATGGVSYPLTGASKDGMLMCEKYGHKVTDLYPALVPLLTKETWSHELMGLALKNVNATIKQGKKVLYEGFGEMLFTHKGVSGPLILSASSLVTKKFQKGDLDLYIDLKPALTEEQLDKRILRDFDEMKKKQLRNAMAKLLPSRLIAPVIRMAEISEEKIVTEITKEERLRLVHTLKNLKLVVTGTADFNEAIITQGGISVKNVNPSTMESKVVAGLFIAGECLDLDAFTGGFNLQIAWSTGYLAGMNA